MDAGLYDGFVKKLRDVARLSETAGDSGLRSFAIQALSELGADLEPSVEDTNAIEYLQPSSPHPATNAPTAPAPQADSADGAKEPAP